MGRRSTLSFTLIWSSYLSREPSRLRIYLYSSLSGKDSFIMSYGILIEGVMVCNHVLPRTCASKLSWAFLGNSGFQAFLGNSGFRSYWTEPDWDDGEERPREGHVATTPRTCRCGL